MCRHHSSSGRLHNCMAFHLLNLHSHFPYHQNLVAGALELDQQLFAIWWLQRGWNTAHVATAFPLSLSVNKTKILLVLETLAMGQDMYLFQWGCDLGCYFWFIYVCLLWFLLKQSKGGSGRFIMIRFQDVDHLFRILSRARFCFLHNLAQNLDKYNKLIIHNNIFSIHLIS